MKSNEQEERGIKVNTMFYHEFTQERERQAGGSHGLDFPAQTSGLRLKPAGNHAFPFNEG